MICVTLEICYAVTKSNKTAEILISKQPVVDGIISASRRFHIPLYSITLYTPFLSYLLNSSEHHDPKLLQLEQCNSVNIPIMFEKKGRNCTVNFVYNPVYDTYNIHCTSALFNKKNKQTAL